MIKLGNIRLSLQNERYSIQFKYSTPRKIDFFELTLMEIIKHSENFLEQIHIKGQRTINGQITLIRPPTIEDILLMMDIPVALHEFFEKALSNIINSSLIELNNMDGLKLLSQNISLFSLTQAGEDAYSSKDILEDPKTFSKEYFYEAVSKSLKPIPNKIQNEDNSVVVHMPVLAKDSVNEIFTQIISQDPHKYISGPRNDKTKISELNAAPTGSVGISDNIAVSINDKGKISFSNEDKVILKAFLEADSEDKRQIRTKNIFNYLDIPQTAVNSEKAKIAVSQQPIKMKVAFGETEAIDAITDTKFKFPIDTGHNFCFAGITADNKPLIYNYCEIDGDGYTIPLEEKDDSAQSYNSIFKAFIEMYIPQIEKTDNQEELIKFIISAAPQEQKTATVKEILAKAEEFDVALKMAKTIKTIISNDKNLLNMVNIHITNLIKKNISEGNIDADKVINIIREYNLPKKPIIKILAGKAPKAEDDIINKLLVLDEDETIRVYQLKKLYNSLLGKGKLSTISHEADLYKDFSAYDKQYKKLQSIGLENYRDYNPKDWDNFIKEVHIFKKKFERIRKDLEGDIPRQATYFFERVQDDYDAFAPVDEKAVGQLSFKNLEEAIRTLNFDASIIAYVIRREYEAYMRSVEKTKEPNADGSRKGKALIQFTVKEKLVNVCHKHWRDLCTLVHKATAGNDSLWKGNDKTRRDALNVALLFYNTELTKGGKI